MFYLSAFWGQDSNGICVHSFNLNHFAFLYFNEEYCLIQHESVCYIDLKKMYNTIE